MNQIPLPEKLRPPTLTGFVGQEHLTGKEGVIKKLITSTKKTGFFPSLIFWGPPGSGKTTLARIIANKLNREFFEFSAVNTSIKDVEEVIKKTIQLRGAPGQMRLVKKKQKKKEKGAPIIFIDEIHRFNKAQQDRLLPHVEKGIIILIGATTENPSFEVIGPMLSRSRVLTLNQLDQKALNKILNKGIKYLAITLEKEMKSFLIESSNGDARVMLNVLEIATNLSKSKKIILKDLEEALQRRQFTFDKKGEEYYNVISAYIKSMRASDVNAALYYLARMVEAGQDPLYIARRMIVFASEDVASPTALVVANAVFRACESIGYPECQENLAAGTVYLAQAKKDRNAYDAYFRAVDDVKKHGNLPVPLKIRNPVTKLMEDLDYGKDYELYSEESLLPEKLKDKKYYEEKE
jgi:putative ATPase